MRQGHGRESYCSGLSTRDGRGGEGNTAHVEHVPTAESSSGVSQSVLPPVLQSLGWEPPSDKAQAGCRVQCPQISSPLSSCLGGWCGQGRQNDEAGRSFFDMSHLPTPDRFHISWYHFGCLNRRPVERSKVKRETC